MQIMEVYILSLTRAGYDISQVKNFWERIGSENPRQIAISSTHPAAAERYLQN